MVFDLLVKNGKLIDNSRIEIGIEKGKIVAVASQLAGEAQEILDLKGESYVSPGWIDGHVHCYEKMSLYYDFPDEIGISKGVTTIIDAGSTGPKNIGDFYQLAKLAKTNVLALVNISEWGIVAQDELADLTKINQTLVREALALYPDFIVGLKARMSKTVVGNNGIIPLELAKKMQREDGPLPLMVHIGSAPPELSEILSRLEKGDIVTHCFNGKENGILASDDHIKEFVWDAYRKGVIFDIGHGTDSFNFHVAEVALAANMTAATISTDIYHRNREDGPVYDLATTLEKLLEVGYQLPDLIDKVTAKPAEFFHLSKKGQLAPGFDGDLTVFSVEEQDKELTDSNGNQRVTHTQIKPQQTIVGGIVYDVE
ncbi:amidohydrolase/deacetylase family metallohydrolase [Vagococcus sp. BWB3-3]|uniref:Amidohydrolase/deacetylase family metallohydrolase n=1 Tax=Vagococcus allomyrinae TaxID=2794353 RepID=A0A940PFT4_9ENTE|nr:amidohydrolase/deacetylase family metallohydrolase [Vagococcus allomyrinae]MBP1042068.1 amidohydrolase/deacetylase family metallohydrolase [Vagococcus allomyrinae]